MRGFEVLCAIGHTRCSNSWPLILSVDWMPLSYGNVGTSTSAVVASINTLYGRWWCFKAGVRSSCHEHGVRSSSTAVHRERRLVLYLASSACGVGRKGERL